MVTPNFLPICRKTVMENMHRLNHGTFPQINEEGCINDHIGSETGKEGQWTYNMKTILCFGRNA